MARPKRPSQDSLEIHALQASDKSLEQPVLTELGLIRESLVLVREQLASLALVQEQLVRYLRNKETAAIKRKKTLHSRRNTPIVAKHQPTEDEVQAAMRQQISWKSQRK